MRALRGPVFDLRLSKVTERKAIALYERTTTQPSKKTERPPLPATQRFDLAVVQLLWKWAQKQGYTQQNPWAEISPTGRISTGKLQLQPRGGTAPSGSALLR